MRCCLWTATATEFHLSVGLICIFTNKDKRISNIYIVIECPNDLKTKSYIQWIQCVSFCPHGMEKYITYREVSNISRTKSQHLKILVLSFGCLWRIPWSQMLSREWRCSWSSADRRCSNNIWVIDNFITYWDASYIRGFTAFPNLPCCLTLMAVSFAIV